MNIVATIALKAVRAYLNNTIGRFTAYDLTKAIHEDRDLWANTPDNIRRQSAVFKGRWGGLLHRNAHLITTPLLVNWLQQDHPHLAKVVMASSDNYKWFDRQVNTIKNEILNM